LDTQSLEGGTEWMFLCHRVCRLHIKERRNIIRDGVIDVCARSAYIAQAIEASADSSFFYQPAARGRLVLRLLCGFRVCWYIYVRHVVYIVAMRPYYLDGCFVYGVATTSSLAQLRVRDGSREAEAT